MLDGGVNKHNKRSQDVERRYEEQRVGRSRLLLALLISASSLFTQSDISQPHTSESREILIQRKRKRQKSTMPPHAGQNRMLMPVPSKFAGTAWSSLSFKDTLCATRPSRVMEKQRMRTLMVWTKMAVKAMVRQGSWNVEAGTKECRKNSQNKCMLFKATTC